MPKCNLIWDATAETEGAEGVNRTKPADAFAVSFIKSILEQFSGQKPLLRYRNIAFPCPIANSAEIPLSVYLSLNLEQSKHNSLSNLDSTVKAFFFFFPYRCIPRAIPSFLFLLLPPPGGVVKVDAKLPPKWSMSSNNVMRLPVCFIIYCNLHKKDKERRLIWTSAKVQFRSKTF